MADDLTPQQVHDRLHGPDAPLLLDVREDWEVATAAVAEAVHIPMNQLPGRVNELPDDRPIACLCHTGVRSLHVALWLEANGYDDVINVAGGIDAWSATVDPTIPRY